MNNYNSTTLDRIAGVLVGTACGDALGAGYEFGSPMEDDFAVSMIGGGPFGFDPGEWTDDTSMAIAIAEVAATGTDLREAFAQDAIVERWLGWAEVAKDVGSQTSAVFRGASQRRTATAATESARLHHERTGRSCGNGALMRTAPVALAFLDDPDGLANAARSISSLTHFDPESGDACVLWCFAIRHAVLNAQIDVRIGLDWLPAQRRSLWLKRIEVAERSRPRDFDRNGWAVQALQAAWSAIITTPVPADDLTAGDFSARHLQLALEAVVRGGRDTDTVAAIAGGLLGARWGVSAVPVPWQRLLHGWPGLRYRDLVKLAVAAAEPVSQEQVLDYTYLHRHSTLTPHPHDPGIILGGVNGLNEISSEVDAVVSLCRMGERYRPQGISDGNLIEIWLIDSTDPTDNSNPYFVLNQAAQAVISLREEGRTVYLHCAAGQSRTPVVAALVGARMMNIEPALALNEVVEALPDPCVNPVLVRWLRELSTVDSVLSGEPGVIGEVR